MAYGDVFHPAGTTRDIKVRGPLWAAIWSLVTFGIYSIYWYYVTAKDLSEYGKSKGYDLGQNPTMTLLALLFGWILLFIPSIIAIYRLTKRIQQAQRLAGSPEQLNGWLALVLILVFSPAYHGYAQSELNKAWGAEGGPVPEKDDMPAHLDSGPSGSPSASTGSADMPSAVGTTSAPPASPEAPSSERLPGT